MSDTGKPGSNRPGGRKKPAGRDSRHGKGRKTLGNPMLWVAPFLLVVILAWALFSSLGGYARIDTSDGLALLKDSPGTVKSITVVDRTQRVEIELTQDYMLQPKETGQKEKNLGTKVQFTFTEAQAEQVDTLVQDAAPAGGFDSVVPTTS